MYERSQNEVTENRYDGSTVKKQPKKTVNYGPYQGYDDGGFQDGVGGGGRTLPPCDGANVVVNLNATGNGVNTVLR